MKLEGKPRYPDCHLPRSLLPLDWQMWSTRSLGQRPQPVFPSLFWSPAPETRSKASSGVRIREEKEHEALAPSRLPAWMVASRVIKLPPARACLQLAPQHHASHTSKLPKTYQQPRPRGKLSKADKPQDTPLDTLPPLGRLLFGGEKA